jgi:hypothetical protein
VIGPILISSLDFFFAATCLSSSWSGDGTIVGMSSSAVARHLPSQRCIAALPVARTSLRVPCPKLNGRSSKQPDSSAIGSRIRGTQIRYGSLKVSELHSPNLRNIGTSSFLVYKTCTCVEVINLTNLVYGKYYKKYITKNFRCSTF